jgi:imidazolonepropionase-like amidohydrolase
MRFPGAVALFLAVVSSCSARAADVLLTHATIYAAPDQPAIHDGALVIHEGRIVAVGSSALIARMLGKIPVVTHDCAGLTITAGFWNSHVHMLPPPLLHAEKQPAAVLDAQMQTMFTRWGFTTVFDVASPLSNTNEIRRRVAAGTAIGPRILTTGDPFWAEVPVYVQQYVAENHISMPAVTSPAEARARVDSEVREGADGIKIFAGSIEPNGIVFLPADIARAVVEQAHHDHRLVFSHPSSIKGVELSLDSGADILAHVTSFEGPWPSELVQRMLAAHMSVIPTLTLFDTEAQKGHATPEETRQLLDLACSQLRKFSAAGGLVLFGTDIGYMEHYDTAEEFDLMTQAGMSFPQILASLTTNPAQRFGYAAHSGRIAVGMDADLVVLKGDPAANIDALSQVKVTVRGGQVIFGSY